MKGLARLFSYAAVVGGLSLALIWGAIWLAGPDPNFQPVARAAPISPRIADSIERKREPPPPPEPVAVQPPMKEANVSLAPPPPRQVIRELTPVPKTKRASKRTPDPNNPAARESPPAQQVPLVTTARTDFPF